jgi:hypothetical protein
LETLHLTGEDRTIRYVANQWRNHYDVPVLHCSAAYMTWHLYYLILNTQTSPSANRSP